MTPQTTDSLIKALVDDLSPVNVINSKFLAMRALVIMLGFCLLIVISRGISVEGEFTWPLISIYFLTASVLLWKGVMVCVPGFDNHAHRLVIVAIVILGIVCTLDALAQYRSGASPFGDAAGLLESIATKIVVIPVVFSIIFAHCRRLPMQRVEVVGNLMFFSSLCIANGVTLLLTNSGGYLNAVLIGFVVPLLLLYIFAKYIDRLLCLFLKIEKSRRSQILV